MPVSPSRNPPHSSTLAFTRTMKPAFSSWGAIDQFFEMSLVSKNFEVPALQAYPSKRLSKELSADKIVYEIPFKLMNLVPGCRPCGRSVLPRFQTSQRWGARRCRRTFPGSDRSRLPQTAERSRTWSSCRPGASRAPRS
jgi:hypothetical protein